MTHDDNIQQLLNAKGGINLDVGCGENKQPGYVGIDYEQYGNTDIIHNVEVTPWPLPDECVLRAVASHLLEHINPHSGDSRLQGLVDLLITKKLITADEAKEYLGDPGPAFLRFMNEVWRVLKPGGQFAFVVPYAGNALFFQDPTHCNNINETTMYYFDPDPEGRYAGQSLYRFYQPKPWKIQVLAADRNGTLECILVKRQDDPSYHNKSYQDIVQEVAAVPKRLIK